MKVPNSPMRRYTSVQDYQEKARPKGPKAAPDTSKAPADQASKVDISPEAQALSQAQAPDPAPAPAPAPDPAPAPAPNLPSIRRLSPEASAKADATAGLADKQIAKIAQIPAGLLEKKDQPIDRPAIFFFKGHVFEGQGFEQMSTNYQGAEEFAYTDGHKAVELILKRTQNQPIVLIGYGMGGDTAMEVAKELNRPEHGFRKVDLLLSLDALGFNNDVVPANVTKNVNYIGNQESWWGLFNDSPKIAKDAEFTKVENILRPEGHTGIDDSEDVQFKVFQHIRRTVAGGNLPDHSPKSGPSDKQSEDFSE